MDGKYFGRNVLEAYLILVLLLMAGTVFLLVRSIILSNQPGFSLITLFIVVLISAIVVNNVLLLRIWDRLQDSPWTETQEQEEGGKA